MVFGLGSLVLVVFKDLGTISKTKVPRPKPKVFMAIIDKKELI
jgi:hypothetical protein